MNNTLYIDRDGNLGEINAIYTHQFLEQYFEANRDTDYCMMFYSTFEEWLFDSVQMY